MKIDQLIYFTETARLEHIGRASKVLGISTSAISHSIASLEGELGYKLFERKGKNIILTEQGRNLLNRSQDLIYQFQNLKQSLLEENTEKMHYKIAASHYLSHRYITAAWLKCINNYPNVTIEIMTYRSAEVVKAVLSREVDFGLCFSPQANPELDSKIIYNGQLILSISKKHPILKMSGEQKVKALNQYSAVLPKGFQGIDICLTHPMFEKFAITPKASTLTDSYDICMELIKNSDHWGLMPDIFICAKKNPNLTYVKPNKGWDAPYNISAIYYKKKFIPNFFNDFEEQIKLELAKFKIK